MSQLSRRKFLAGAAALTATPAFGQGMAPAGGPAADVDVIIVGAGAAGIAAARRLSAAGRSFTLVEATDRIGGRCFTDTSSFNVPFDRGAHWILSPDINPLTKLATRTGLDIYQAPSGQRVRIGQRSAREGELEDYLSAVVRSNRAIGETVMRGRTDMDCLRALPKDLGEWQATVEFALGPYATGRDLRDMSALDFSKWAERDAAAFCRQGYGALLAKLAEGIPVEMESPVSAVDTGRGRVEATTPRGTISARFMIVTASTNVLASERIKFDRAPLPKRQADALAALRLGSLDHIALDLPGNPLGLQRDDLVFEKASGPRTAALLANVSGSSLSLIEVGGRFGRDLMAQGDVAAVNFAAEWLAGLFGNNVKSAVQRVQVTRWNNAPWVQGAISTASPGNQWARAALREPMRERIYLAGEATHDTLWGTVGGAWESGERAADQVLRRLSGLPDLPPPKPEPEPTPPAPRATTAQAKPQAKSEEQPKPKSRSRGGSSKSSGKSSKRRRAE